MMPIVLFAARDLPEYGIQRGDRIVFSPAHSAYPSVCRDLHNVGAILGAFERGDLITLTGDVQPADLRAAVGLDGPSSTPPSSSRRRHLRLI